MELNRIYQIDVLEGLRQLPDKSVDLIITSPPYNKGKRGYKKPDGHKHWVSIILYNGDHNTDNMPEEEYQQWQVDIINECLRVLKDDGSLFYNHKDRIVVGKGYVINPMEWISKSDAMVRQIIVWDRKRGVNYNTCRYTPSNEYIYWLTKSPKVRFNLRYGKEGKDVWILDPDVNNAHPAPFPISIPDNIIPCVAQGKRITVLDPFMGSGTVALSAIKNGCDYIGFEKYDIYVEQANKRIKEYVEAR